jgi:ribonuclease HI
MGVGVIVRDHNGEVCAAKSEVIQRLHEPDTGEAWGALRAVEFCEEMGFFDIILEGDSLNVVKAVGESEASWKPFGKIVEDTKVVLGSLRSWED